MMKQFIPFCILSIAIAFVGCQQTIQDPVDESATLPNWYYAGGLSGTSYLSTTDAFEQPTPKIQQGDWMEAFKDGEALFEKPFNSNASGTRSGLGPVYVRNSCIHCHPGYSHGKSVEEGTYNSTEIGNGTLLVIFNPQTQAYVTWVAGMPQLHAVAPFKAPIDESQISVHWNIATTCAASGNKMAFADGETFELRYPEVTMPQSAIYGVDLLAQMGADVDNYEVRLENTIGIYGTGLTDAIPDDSITAQWAKEEAQYAQGYLKHWKSEWFTNGQWLTYYKGTTGTPYVRRYTYAMSRGPILDAAGANAIWNITNVTRSDRRKHYLDLAGTYYATISSKDQDVQSGWLNYINKLIAADSAYARYNTGDVEKDIYAYLTAKDLPVEMSDDDYADFMIWHRGLAVPAARNVQDKDVQRGHELFTQIGCAQCHRPSWTTGPDYIQDPNGFFTRNNQMPRYPYQTIWPYTDFVQHQLCMEKDIRTGWCRTTPLWGKGLHRRTTGDIYDARMHDTRARNVIEAIMWHGYSDQSDAYECTKSFYNLSKEDRDALVAFVNAI